MKAREQDYTPEEKEKILNHIYGEVSSGRSLDGVLRNDEQMCSRSTFWRWHMDDETVRDNLARARENGVEALMEQALDIAQNTLEGDEITEEDVLIKGVKKGTARKVVTKDMLGHRRLQIDTILKRAQMIKPRKYGPKLDLTSDGEKIAPTETEAAVRLAKLVEKYGSPDNSE